MVSAFVLALVLGRILLDCINDFSILLCLGIISIYNGTLRYRMYGLVYDFVSVFDIGFIIEC